MPLGLASNEGLGRTSALPTECFYPLDLLVGVGNGDTASATQDAKDLAGRYTDQMQKTASNQAGAADSGTTVDSDGLAGEQTHVQAIYELVRLALRGRNSSIRDGKGLEEDAVLGTKACLHLQVELMDLTRFKKRDDCMKASALPCADFVL